MADICTSYGYKEAWRHWIAGERLEDACLYGVQVLWLDRVGKILSAIAGLVIAVDIIGEERLKTYTEYLYFRHRTYVPPKLPRAVPVKLPQWESKRGRFMTRSWPPRVLAMIRNRRADDKVCAVRAA
jgi:hypothetical protein